MLRGLRKLFDSPPAEVAPSDKKERIQAATCVILLEMAHADGEFHEMEAVLMEDLLQRKFGLQGEARRELIEFAREERERSIDLYQYTSRINDHFSEEEKLAVMESLWRIVYADGVLDKYEDYLIRRLSTLLRISHRRMIEAKVKVLDEVGRPPRPARP